MNVSSAAKALTGAAILVVLLLYVVLLDLGINAGRVHHGVSVRGFDVGGLTEEEARAALRERGRELKAEAVVFTTEGFHCPFLPEDLGWRARPKETAERARSIGFDGGIVNAVSERARAWWAGVEIEWAGDPQPWKVSGLIDECEKQAEGLGLELKRLRFRRLIAEAIETWPRRTFEIPVERT